MERAMLSLILISNEIYPELIVTLQSNSFGDQILEFRYEALDGKFTYKTATYPEGEWQSFDVVTMYELYQRLQ